MLSVLRLSEWQKRSEVEPRQLSNTRILKDALQSVIAQCHVLTSKAGITTSDLAIPPFQMYLHTIPAVADSNKPASGACEEGVEVEAEISAGTEAVVVESEEAAAEVVEIEMAFSTSLWEEYAHNMFQAPLFPGCCNPSCVNLSGASEAALPTQQCGCKRARYCSLECRQAGWVAGRHSQACTAKRT